MSVVGRTLFTPIRLEARVHETDAMGLQVLRKTLPSPDSTMSLTSDLEHVSISIENLQEKLGLAVVCVSNALLVVALISDVCLYWTGAKYLLLLELILTCTDLVLLHWGCRHM